MEYSTSGTHIIADLWGVEFEKLNDPSYLENQLKIAAKKSGATMLSCDSQAFEPFGATVFVVLSESHLSIHTYPEKGFAAVDGYTCGETIDPMDAVLYLISVLQPQKQELIKLTRGEGKLEVKKIS
ncbi:adenosylmethionine decarboxylase [Bacillus sp. AFS015802]|uniref:adenosylmethionine decarboxylase n=1 Tax=Bacillus sp. AFS015802 TaxID=2033486 RepID=UPI000BF68154|nr:adenosylmethionine decarboxylase [Bacillus sp. AFS015802]PFA68437.1 adenosylmethionine decarboxylase [Bacillus sp. AFS015802]